MKNREKFREEIIKAIKSRETCEFMNDTVIPEFIGSKTDSKCICEMGDCRACLIRFTLWLDEEYTEPPKQTVLSTVVEALEFGFACWGVVALVMSVIA